MSEDHNDDEASARREFYDLNYVAVWRFAFAEAAPGLAVMQVAFGRTASEAAAEFKDLHVETSAIKFVIDRAQAADLSADLQRCRWDDSRPAMRMS